MLVRLRRRQRQKVGWNSDGKWRAVVVETVRLMSGRGIYPLGVEGSKSGVHGGDAASVSWWAALANEIVTRHRCGR